MYFIQNFNSTTRNLGRNVESLKEGCLTGIKRSWSRRDEHIQRSDLPNFGSSWHLVRWENKRKRERSKARQIKRNEEKDSRKNQNQKTVRDDKTHKTSEPSKNDKDPHTNNLISNLCCIVVRPNEADVATHLGHKLFKLGLWFSHCSQHLAHHRLNIKRKTNG